MEEVREHNRWQDDRLAKVERKCDSADTVINFICTDMNHIKVHVAEMRADIDWVKKIQWAVLTFTLGTVVVTFINLIFLVVNSQKVAH